MSAALTSTIKVAMTARTASTHATPEVIDAARRAVGAIEVRLALAQHDVRERHQDVGDRRAEDCAVEQGRPGAGERRRKPMTAGTTSATHGVLRLPVTESSLGR